MEEQNLLFSSVGALTRPATVTVPANGAATGGSLSDGTYTVSVTALNYWGYKLMYKKANTGTGTIVALVGNARNGETNLRAGGNTAVLNAGTAVQSIPITWTKSAGAIAYAVYLTLSGTQYLVGIVGHNSFTATALTYAGNTISGTIAPTTDASALDTDGQTVGYSGFYQQLLDTDIPAEYTDLGAAGLSAVAGGTGVGELDAMLEKLFRVNGVSPGSITIPSLDWRGWQSALLNTSSTNYRLEVMTDEGTKVSAGQVISTIKNPYSGDAMEVIVHPLMAPGKAFLYTRDLPYEANNTGVNLSHYFNVRYLQKIFAKNANWAEPGPWGIETIGQAILTYPGACGLLENIKFGDSF
jgi:hypothetical protein